MIKKECQVPSSDEIGHVENQMANTACSFEMPLAVKSDLSLCCLWTDWIALRIETFLERKDMCPKYIKAPALCFLPIWQQHLDA